MKLDYTITDQRWWLWMAPYSGYSL